MLKLSNMKNFQLSLSCKRCNRNFIGKLYCTLEYVMKSWFILEALLISRGMPGKNSSIIRIFFVYWPEYEGNHAFILFLIRVINLLLKQKCVTRMSNGARLEFQLLRAQGGIVVRRAKITIHNADENYFQLTFRVIFRVIQSSIG